MLSCHIDAGIPTKTFSAKLEASFTQMRKTLERVMTSVHVQTARPTGFASCWKQAPMTLEDAHGELLPHPLELVVSWEVSHICTLINHI